MTIASVTPSKRPRHGRRFEPVGERDLASAAIRAAETLPGTRAGLLVLQEVAGPFGVADYVAVIGSQDRIRDRLALAVPPLLNEIDAGIVSATSPRRARTAERFAERLGWSRSSVDRRLPGLVKSGALQEVKPGRFVRHEALVPVGRVYAIETKLREWRRALRQARTYRLWSDNYVIVMPSLSAGSLTEALSAVTNDGGGLFIDERWATRPRSRHPEPGRRLWGSEHVVAALRGPELPTLRGTEALQAGQ